MIVNINDNGDDVSFTTSGCGCCSETLYLLSDREEIINELKRNIRVTRNACDVLGITMDELINM